MAKEEINLSLEDRQKLSNEAYKEKFRMAKKSIKSQVR